LAQLRQQAPQLASKLEAQEGTRPYTLSTLIYWRVSGETGEAHQPLIRITSLDQELSHYLLETFLPQLPGQTLSLGEHDFKVQAYSTQQQEHPLAGQTTAETLIHTYTLNRPAPSRIAMRFYSPTAFKYHAEMSFPIPLPSLVFGNLLQRWNAHNPVQLHPEAKRFAEECITIGRYRAASEHIRFSMGELELKLTGTVGYYRYQIFQGDAYWRGLMHALAAYSFYAGVGIRTSMGFGRADYLPLTNKIEEQAE
jgi:CRISPR-associated endoribonuclease Cas6